MTTKGKNLLDKFNSSIVMPKKLFMKLNIYQRILCNLKNKEEKIFLKNSLSEEH